MSRADSPDSFAGLDAIFRPRSVAVIGASRSPGSIGREILYNIVDCEFQGKVYPVNPHSDVIHSMKCYASVREIPDPIDLAVVAVPATAVEQVLTECGQKGVVGLIVITAGFGELGTAGRGEEARLLSICQEFGMRMIGPNCMGVINTDPRVQLNATFAPTRPTAGKIAFLSQSGALGVAILNLAERTGLGVSSFASIGNRADVNASDLIEYWAADPRTKLILMYLESFGDPTKFTRLAREITREKPIVMVKSGRTEAGARAAAGHTGALANREASIQALCAQCGLIRVPSIDELFDVGKVLVSQPLPRGHRVGIVTNAGGPAIMVTDALVAESFELADFSPQTRDTLREYLPAHAQVDNPVDMIAGADEEEYGRSLAAVLDDPGVDAAIVIFVPPIMVDPVRVSRRIFHEARARDKPVLGCFMAEEHVLEQIIALDEDRIPIFRFPEACVRALAALRTRARWLARPGGREVAIDARGEEAREIIERARRGPSRWLAVPEAFQLLDCYGIPFARPRKISVEGPLPEGLGYPVVLKAMGAGIVHKSDLGGVRIGLENDTDLDEARAEMVASLGRHGIDLAKVCLFVQPQQRAGRELIFGVSNDSLFGPIILFGLGGIYVEVFQDTVCRHHPLTDQDAYEMVRGLRGHALLEGVRGDPPVDMETLASVLLRLNRLVTDVGPDLESLEINPFIADDASGVAVDCRVRLAED